MKNNNFSLRQQRILQNIESQGRMRVKELANEFQVSELTIRRDLDELEAAGRIYRFHGGAELAETSLSGAGESAAKIAIAAAAAASVQNGDTLFINSSSTALLALKHLHNKHLTVITNNCKALAADVDPRIKLVLTGGDISFPKEALTGEFALSSLNLASASRCILGISGLSPENGLTSANLAEIAVNERMLARTAGEKIIVAESHKLGKDSAFVTGKITAVDTLYTDSRADAGIVASLRAQGVRVILVSPS